MTAMSTGRPSIDRVTVIGLACLLMPLLTMWHEIGGHAATCLALGGRIEALGAFYVDCQSTERWRAVAVAAAGASVDAVLAVVAYALWRRARRDFARLLLWYVWLGKAFAASGYLLFSGVSGIGDLGVVSGGFAGTPYPWLVRLIEIAIGGLLYWRLVVAGIATLSRMIGTGSATVTARRTVAHLYYAMVGLGAVVVGLLNPLGLFITIASAAASTLGGQAGLISIGFAPGRPEVPLAFTVGRHWPVLVLGILVLAAFALVLGPSIRPR